MLTVDYMVDENGTLIPDKYPQGDLFICDVADAILKEMAPVMEHPFYSLSKKPVKSISRYEHNDAWVEIVPSVCGQPTIYDKDILIYCISQVMAKHNRGEPVSRRVQINSRELLQFTNRGDSGRDYMALNDALDRLAGVMIRTNITTGDIQQTDRFHLVEQATITRKLGLDGRLMSCVITLSDWVFNAIRANAVLTLHRDYFRLRKPLERRMYELARKHCGTQVEWKISLDNLLKKSGARSPRWRFKEMVKHICKHDYLPDYRVSIDENDVVIFCSRGTVPFPKNASRFDGYIDSDSYEKARARAPGWDVHYLEEQWRAWCGKQKIAPKQAGAHFVKFCKSWFDKRGRP
jgi:hypothetical protein